MNRRTLVEFVTAWILILEAAAIMILPIFNIMNIRIVFIITISLYGIIHLVKNFALINAKDFSGFNAALSCVVALVLLFFLGILSFSITITNFVVFLIVAFILLISKKKVIITMIVKTNCGNLT